MTGLLSTVTGQFSKALILGSLLPATIAVLLFLAVLAPLLPSGFALPGALGTLFTDWEGLGVTLVVTLLAALLHALSIPIIRLYEGYPWMRGWIGKWLVGVHRRQYSRLATMKAGVDKIFLDASQSQKPHFTDDAALSQIDAASSAGLLSLRQGFPMDVELVLPTRLGNVIRSFETYPSQEYGIDAIIMWPRLIGVLEDPLSSAIDDARINVVFFLNTSLLLAVLSLASLGLTLTPATVTFPGAVLPAALFALVSWLLYSAAVGAAGGWGATVKAAFDLRRGALLEHLTGASLPESRIEERELWGKITTQMIYGDPPGGQPYVDPPVEEISDAGPVVCRGIDPSSLELARGLVGRGSRRRVTVVFQLRNTHKTHAATDIEIWDAPPAGFDYEWNTAEVDGQPVKVHGVEPPYCFRLTATLDANAELELRYGARRLPLGRTVRAAQPLATETQ